MSKVVEWADLPGDLLDYIADGLFSKVELLRFRSICKSWRSSVVTTKKRFLNHRNRNRRRYLSSYDDRTCLLAPAALCRVILSSSPDKGWLIKTKGIGYASSKSKLLSPLSLNSIDSSSCKTLDLLKFTVSEIHQSYDVRYVHNSTKVSSSYRFDRVVLVGDLVFVVNSEKQIWWCNSTSETDKPWARVMDEEVQHFSDIILHKGHIYALDLKGAIWWISLSELNIFQYGPSTPVEDYEIDDCKEKRLVEYCGDLCVVHRFRKEFLVKRFKIEMTTGFKVYKMDVENVKWVEVKSLGDEAFLMATDTCFSVLARDYYGCLDNSIYFIDIEEINDVKVFKLGDGSITKMADSSYQSCFQMLIPPSFV